MRVLLAGAPGAGKGTQAALLAHELGVPHLVSGDLIRESIDAGTPAGVAAQEAVQRGDLVADDVVLELLLPPLRQAAARGGYVLDGFPRTAPQARALHDAAAADDASVELAVHLDVPEDRLTERLLARGRDDDTADVIAHRLEVYRRQTVPMLDVYAERGELVTLDGDADADEVADRIVRDVQVWLLRRPLAS